MSVYRRLWKYNSMGVGVKKCHPPMFFFWNNPYGFFFKIELTFILASRFFCSKLNFACGKILKFGPCSALFMKFPQCAIAMP